MSCPVSLQTYQVTIRRFPNTLKGLASNNIRTKESNTQTKIIESTTSGCNIYIYIRLMIDALQIEWTCTNSLIVSMLFELRLQKFQAALDDVKHLLPMLDCLGGCGGTKMRPSERNQLLGFYAGPPGASATTERTETQRRTGAGDSSCEGHSCEKSDLKPEAQVQAYCSCSSHQWQEP